MAENDTQTQESNPLTDMIRGTLEGNHVAVQDAFDRAISAKIANTLDTYKQQMANAVFEPDQDDDFGEEDTEEQVDDTEEDLDDSEDQ